MYYKKGFKIDKNTQFAVLGLGKFGKSVFQVLNDNNYQVLGCDSDRTVVNEVAQYADNVVEGDITDPAVIESLGLGNFDVVIVSLSDDFEASIITVMIAKEKGVPFVLAKSNGIRQKKILESVGADCVVMPEIEIGARVANNIISSDPLVRLNQSEEYDILEMHPKREWVGKSIKDLGLRENDSINIISIFRDEELMAVLDPNMKIESHDVLLVIEISKEK